jgi:hypothetical protein
VNNRTQKISIKYKESEEFITNGIPDKKIAEILIPMIENFETTNISLDLFNN